MKTTVAVLIASHLVMAAGVMADMINFDGENVIEAVDDTIKGAGAVGVWTKADSVTLFDDCQYGNQ